MAVEHSGSNKSWRRSSSSSFLHCCRTPLMAIGPLAGIDQKEEDLQRYEMGSSSSDNFSVLVPASDLGIDARPFSSKQDREGDEQENWHDCSQQFSDEDFSDLDFLQFFRLEGSDKSGNRIFCIVGKYFPYVIGLLSVVIEWKEVIEWREVTKNGSPLNMISFELDDLSGNKLHCTLWENFAVEMCSVIDKSYNESVIFVIQFAKMKSWRGVMGISNTMFNTRIFINNYDILEVLAFKERSPLF